MIPYARASALGALLITVVISAASTPEDAQRFHDENGAAMERMMAAMHVPPTGDVDRDFVAMMIPHHQGAIDMARAQLRYGRDQRLKRLAQEIIVTQQQEIAVMRTVLRDPHTQSNDQVSP